MGCKCYPCQFMQSGLVMMWTGFAGLQRLSAFTPDALRRALEQAELSLQGSSQFQDFYVFAFRYCLTVRFLTLLSIGLCIVMSKAGVLVVHRHALCC